MSARRTTAAIAAGTLTITTLAVAGLAPTTANAVADTTPGYSVRHISVDVLVLPIALFDGGGVMSSDEATIWKVPRRWIPAGRCSSW